MKDHTSRYEEANLKLGKSARTLYIPESLDNNDVVFGVVVMGRSYKWASRYNRLTIRKRYPIERTSTSVISQHVLTWEKGRNRGREIA